jgi:hypothetical protein
MSSSATTTTLLRRSSRRPGLRPGELAAELKQVSVDSGAPAWSASSRGAKGCSASVDGRLFGDSSPQELPRPQRSEHFDEAFAIDKVQLAGGLDPCGTGPVPSSSRHATPAFMRSPAPRDALARREVQGFVAPRVKVMNLHCIDLT